MQKPIRRLGLGRRMEFGIVGRPVPGLRQNKVRLCGTGLLAV